MRDKFWTTVWAGFVAGLCTAFLLAIFFAPKCRAEEVPCDSGQKIIYKFRLSNPGLFIRTTTPEYPLALNEEDLRTIDVFGSGGLKTPNEHSEAKLYAN